MVTSTFKVVGDDHGVYYDNSERIIIYLDKHENMEDLLSTITHEYLHHCVKDEDLDIDQEERLIFSMLWAHEYSA
tara:strand:+ start:762 stop:986 length:225 start_codon:yes stop_codon:yes gene_type:complete